MKPMTRALHLGVARGWIEFATQTLSRTGIFGVIFAPAILVAILWFFKDRQSDGVSTALLLLPSFLGFQLAQEALMSVANKLALDREDGTLLRAKALPQGMVAYLISRSVMAILSSLLSLLLVLVPGLLVVFGVTSFDGVDLFTLAWVTILGYLAIAPLGAVIGATVSSPTAALALTLLPLIGMVAVSGIFYPISAFPEWLQWIGQALPLYWLGLGLRSALLPDLAVALEIGGSWRTLETAVVLTAWSAAGLLLAPGVLRRMAQRTSGSEMEAGRRRYSQRGY